MQFTLKVTLLCGAEGVVEEHHFGLGGGDQRFNFIDFAGACKKTGIGALADASLTYAAANRRRWATLFEHRMAGDRPTPDWYRARLAHLFAHVEAPLGALCPVLDEAARACLARSLFSAVQGVVALGLDEKVGPMPEPTLRAHLRLLARAMAQGLKPGG